MTYYMFGANNAPSMNIYSLFPLIAAIAFIPLLFTTIATRPLQKQHKLFISFLIPAMLWSLTDFFARSSYFPQYSLLLLKFVLVMFTWVAVQFHCFSSSFFSIGERRWLPLAYGTLAAAIVMAVAGIFPRGVVVSGAQIYPDYGPGVIVLAVPLVMLLARNLYVFRRKLKNLDNPVLYNQIVTIIIGLFILTGFTLAALLPWGREFPVSHIGNIANAILMSYAVIRHKLVDINFVVRRGLVWISLGVIGIISYWLLLLAIHALLKVDIDISTTLLTSIVAILIVALVYRLRNVMFVTVSKAFQGESYNYRQRLAEFAGNIHKLFSLREQGGELLMLVTRALGCTKACLLFIELGSEDFVAQLVEPKKEGNPLSGYRLAEHNPIVEYLKREHAPLIKVNLEVLPEFHSLWREEKEEIKAKGIELFMPLISREKLVGILVLDKKQSGRYSLEDFSLLEEVTGRVAVSMEKEYIREQLREREKELSVINRSSSIITSSLDIERTYDSFIQEMKKVVDVSWAAVTMIEDNEVYFLALSTEVGSAWQVGERIPKKGTATEWISAHKEALIEPDLLQECRFSTGKYHIEHGIRSIIYLPLIAREEVIGSLSVASGRPNAYSQRNLKLLEELAMQIAMSIENSRLYAKAEQRARIDGLTGLLNRRSLDELIGNEINRHSRYGGIFSVIILDVDSFKAFNDRYGHLAGDEILKQVSKVIRGSIRSTDQAFRYGGDEFAVLLPQTNIDAAYVVAERIRNGVAAEVDSADIAVTTSLGLASWPADGIGANEIIAAADAALYLAKRSGCNQSQRFPGTLEQAGQTMINTKKGGEDSEDLSAIYAMAAIVNARDHYTRSHSKKVNEYAVALAEALKLDTLEVSRLSTCALLHDVGKIGITDEILNKPGKLTAEEWEVIRSHPMMGAAIASHARHLSPCIPGILHHHERYDGTGYPAGLKGEEIPLEARILAIADAFAAMTSERHYSNALPYEQAFQEIRYFAGTHFDPHLVEVFLSVAKDITGVPVKQSTK